MKSYFSDFKVFLYVPFGGRVDGLILSFTLGAVALIGDTCVKVFRNEVAKAVSDNITHGLLGFLSWYIVTSGYNVKLRIIESMLCAFIASAIDADHFISARSIHLKDAVRIQSRPFFHCTTFVIIITLILHAVATVFHYCSLVHVTFTRLPWIFFMATISHHIRDGNRRGLWLWPLPFWSSGDIYSTPPISKLFYLIFTMILPHVLKYVIVEGGGNPLPSGRNIFVV